jgi:hypothetical protein
MKPKIKIVYLIGQFESWWEEQFYIPQIRLLQETGLIEESDHIDIHVTGGNESLPFLPENTRMVYYHRDSMDAMNEAMRILWDDCRKNPEYKVLFFHSDGVTHFNRDSRESKLSHLEFIHYSLIELWRENIRLLDYYDCSGVNYIHCACFKNNNEGIFAPHYRGMFWWANGEYITRLNKLYLDQDVFYKRYLCELWIGTGNPRAYTLHNTLSKHTETLTSFYRETTEFDKDRIKEITLNHIEDLENLDFKHYRVLKDVYDTYRENDYFDRNFYRKWG